MMRTHPVGVPCKIRMQQRARGGDARGRGFARDCAGNFRSARQVVLRQVRLRVHRRAGGGQSNLLFAGRALLDPLPAFVGRRHARPAEPDRATLADGRVVSFDDRGSRRRSFPRRPRRRPPEGDGGSASGAAVQALVRESWRARRAAGGAGGLEACAAGVSGVVFAIEEPELRPPSGAPVPVPADRAPRRAREPDLLHDTLRLFSVALDEVNPGRPTSSATAVERLRDRHRRHLPRDVRVRRRACRALPRARGDPGRGMTEDGALFVFHALGYDPIASRSRWSSAAASRTCPCSSDLPAARPVRRPRQRRALAQPLQDNLKPNS